MCQGILELLAVLVAALKFATVLLEYHVKRRDIQSKDDATRGRGKHMRNQNTK